MKTKYIIQLSNDKQENIKKDLEVFFREELDLTKQEIKDEMELAMSGRLIDLEDSIDINQYMN